MLINMNDKNKLVILSILVMLLLGVAFFIFSVINYSPPPKKIEEKAVINQIEKNDLLYPDNISRPINNVQAEKISTSSPTLTEDNIIASDTPVNENIVPEDNNTDSAVKTEYGILSTTYSDNPANGKASASFYLSKNNLEPIKDFSCELSVVNNNGASHPIFKREVTSSS